MKTFLRMAMTILAVLSSTATIIASTNGTGVYRTAITLTNGTQEIFPDTVVTRFTYTKNNIGGNTHYMLNIIKNGEVAMTIPTDSIVSLDYGEMTYYEQFAGDWYLVTSPNGEANAQGIMISQVVSVPYHAVLPAPGTPDYGEYIYCHIDSMPHRKGLKYPADFKLRYDYDESAQQGSITMMLDDQTPLSDTHYTDDASTYAYFDQDHTYYYGVQSGHSGGDTGNRYMYFVSRNIDTGELVGMELPAQWTASDQLDTSHAYTFNPIYEIYWIVALDIPYSYAEYDEVGFIDIFASTRLQRAPYVKPAEE